jgi:C1A family cysteine protease
MPSEIGRSYGVPRRDAPDYRDFGMLRFAAPKAVLPSSVDHAAQLGPIKDQGAEGSCTGHAGTEMFERLVRTFPEQFAHLEGRDPAHLVFSAQCLYREELDKEGATGDDGAQMRTIVWALRHLGVCPEASDPYQAGGWSRKLTPDQIAQAFNFRSGAYHRLGTNSVDDMKACLAYGGAREQYTFVGGFAVYSSFESKQVAADGLMPVPGTYDFFLGGHAVHFVGYNDAVRCPNTRYAGAFKVQNSWGPGWGQGGFFWFPYEAAANPNVLWDAWMCHMGPAWK